MTDQPMYRTTSLVAGLFLCAVFVIVLLVAFSLSQIGALAKPAAQGEIGSQQAEDLLAISHPSDLLDFSPSFTATLPVVLSGYRYRPPCTPESPFSITIAAIHEVSADETQDAPERALAEAEWLERIEEGYPTLVEALTQSGACWTRVELKWSQIQPEPPPAPYKFAFFDEKLQLLADSGVQVLALVNGIPYWAADSPAGPIDPERLPDFAQFLTDLASRYKQPPYNIHHWELLNEPDWTWDQDPSVGWGRNGDQYAAMLGQAYPAIKAVDVNATVLMGGIAHDRFTEYDGPFYRYFPDDVMAGGGGGFIDAANFHFFPGYALEWERWSTGDPPTCGIVDDGIGDDYEAGGVDVIAKASHLINRLSVCSGVDKPLWLTEMGEHGYEGDLPSLNQQARYVLQGYARALAVGMENVSWYVLVSPYYEPWQQGLLYEDDWSPKPAFYTYQTLTYELTGFQYSRTLNVPRVEGYAFRNASSGLEKVLAWSWGEAHESGTLTFAPASTLRIVNREGQVTFVQDGGLGDVDQIPGSVTIRLPAVPAAPNPALLTRYTAEPLIISKE